VILVIVGETIIDVPATVPLSPDLVAAMSLYSWIKLPDMVDFSISERFMPTSTIPEDCVGSGIILCAILVKFVSNTGKNILAKNPQPMMAMMSPKVTRPHFIVKAIREKKTRNMAAYFKSVLVVYHISLLL